MTFTASIILISFLSTGLITLIVRWVRFEIRQKEIKNEIIMERNERRTRLAR